MENTRDNTQVTGANPVNGAENTPVNTQGNDTTTQPQVEKSEGKTFLQKDLDDTATKARGSAKRETRRRIIAELGLKDDELDKLSAFKQAYQNSLSEEEKRNQIMEDLQVDNLRLYY